MYESVTVLGERILADWTTTGGISRADSNLLCAFSLFALGYERMEVGKGRG
jgi:hypothetical protein